MIVERILLAELKGMPQTTTYEEKRIIVIGAARLISETIQALGLVFFVFLLALWPFVNLF